jgi:hypothetical protein
MLNTCPPPNKTPPETSRLDLRPGWQPAHSAPRPPGTSFTLLLLLDAFRPDYLRHTPFIRNLANHSATGFLRECFGFLPRAAYFGGLNAEQFGFTNMYCFDPENSVFSSARTVAGAIPQPPSEIQAFLRRFVENKARLRLPAFAKAYASSAQIPLAYLPYFDLVEKRAPWDREAGFESLFGLLGRQKIAWHQCSWPESNRLADHSDAGIVRHVLQTLRPEHRLAYVHLGELDGIGHLHGPGSRALQTQLARTDDLCRQLIESARAIYPAVNVILFGDHGMVNVTTTLDLTPIIESTGLRFGSDFAYFLDSTMARFWFFHRGAEQAMRAAFRNVSGGRLLSADEMKQFGIAGCDRRNGEVIFLADPGVLLFPNFFQAEGEPIKGMHGYDPDCADNLGLFLLHRADQPELAGRRLGKVNPHQIFPLLKCLLDLPETSDEPGLTSHPAESCGRFTPQTEPAADAAVQRHMDAIVKAVCQKVSHVQAMVLTGSFGRGEGGIFQDRAGAWRPVNDYDIFVVSAQDCSRELKDLSEPLAKELGLDYLDLGWTDGRWTQWPLTVANFDLKYGSQVITGDPRILDTLPAYAAAELPAYEAVKLLLNRTAGLLTGLRGPMFAGRQLTADEHRYLCNQISKAQMALGDSYLLRWGAYDASYRVRRERFAALATGAGLAAELTKSVLQGYDFKLHPDYSLHADPLATVGQFRPLLEAGLAASVNHLASRQAGSLSEVMDLYLATMSEDAGWVRSDNALFLKLPAFRDLLQKHDAPAFSLRHQVYAALPELLASAFDPSLAQLSAVMHRMEPGHFKLSGPDQSRFVAWENLRALIIKAWFIIHH